MGGGGMGTVTRLVTQQLKKTTPEANVVVLDPRGDGSVVLFPLYLMRAFLVLIVHHITRGVDVLHLNVSERMSFVRKGLFLIYGRLFSIPVVLHHHGAEFIPEYEKRSALYRWLVAKVIHNADCNIVLGKTWFDYLHDVVGVPSHKIEIMYNAVANPQNSSADIHNRYPIQLLILANLSPRKGVGVLLDSMKSLRNRGHDVFLTLAGGGEIERYRQQATDMGLADHCHFTGWISPDDVEVLLHKADIFVLPSFHEGLPMSILEALSHSVPVVATPVGSIGEVLTSGKNCLLVPAGDTQALESALEQLIISPDRRHALSEAGRDLFLTTFELQSYVDRLLGLYGGLLPVKIRKAA